jgi:isopenicillin-N N-acyltransferase like protein
MESQKQNLIITKITQEGKPTIIQVTEAGIIGKIGFNSNGVGTCLNAIRILGTDEERLPVHLGLRMVLESESTVDAIERLESFGMASSAHILIADPSTAVGLEFSTKTFAKILPDAQHRVMHSNHMLLDHPGVIDTAWLKDSPVRVQRIGELSNKLVTSGNEPTLEEFSKLFEDESNYPAGICRAQDGISDVATLFNIVMDLKSKTAVVRKGRPSKPEQTINLSL